MAQSIECLRLSAYGTIHDLRVLGKPMSVQAPCSAGKLPNSLSPSAPPPICGLACRRVLVCSLSLK